MPSGAAQKVDTPTSSDLRCVSFMDCAGVRGLLQCRDQVTASGGRFELGRVSPRVARILKLTGLYEELGSRPVLIRCLKLRVVGVSSPTKPRETASPPAVTNRAPSPKTWFRSRAQPPCLRPPRLPSRRPRTLASTLQKLTDTRDFPNLTPHAFRPRPFVRTKHGSSEHEPDPHAPSPPDHHQCMPEMWPTQDGPGDRSTADLVLPTVPTRRLRRAPGRRSRSHRHSADRQRFRASRHR